MWGYLIAWSSICTWSEHGLGQCGAPKLVTISYERSIWNQPYVEGGKYGRAWQERCQSDTKSNTPWSIKGTRRPPLFSPYRLPYTYYHHCELERINNYCNQRLQLRRAPSNIFSTCHSCRNHIVTIRRSRLLKHMLLSTFCVLIVFIIAFSLLSLQHRKFLCQCSYASDLYESWSRYCLLLWTIAMWKSLVAAYAYKLPIVGCTIRILRSPKGCGLHVWIRWLLSRQYLLGIAAQKRHWRCSRLSATRTISPRLEFSFIKALVNDIMVTRCQ